jgi:RNA polymerase sigma factor (sigma-70 family)
MASVIGSAILRTQTDERLVALARTGHGRAFEAISERYRAELTRSLRRILPPGSVDDALQQTHLQAWKALSGGTDVRELRAWLHEIARNAARAVASRGYDYDELKEALLVTPGPEHDLERREAVRRALRGIAELPERQREALLAVAVGGRSHAEVALDLGITDTAARQLVRRARVSLLAMSSVAIPPQLVHWAARGGHAAIVGKAAAGTGAGKAAAGTGLGGGLAGSALKVGAVAVTVGGVAVGVAPIRQALAPPPPAHVARHHRHHAPRTQPIRLAAVNRTRAAGILRPAASTQTSTRSSAPPAARRHHVRRISPGAVGKAVLPAPAPSPTPAGAPAAAPAPTPAATAVNAPPGAAAVLAALAAWWSAAQRVQAAAVSAGQSGSPGSSWLGHTASAGTTAATSSCPAAAPAAAAAAWSQSTASASQASTGANGCSATGLSAGSGPAYTGALPGSH